MNSKAGSTVKTAAIEANLAALHSLLMQATTRTSEGCEHIRQGQCDMAIGAIFNLESILEDAKALYLATITLHRCRVI